MPRIHQVTEFTNERERYRTWRWHEPVGYLLLRGMSELASDHTLKGQEFRLLLGLFPYVQWGNTCTCTLTQAGRDVGLGVATVSRVARRLVAARALCLEPRPQTRQHYVIHLSPALVWRGRPWLQQAAVRHYLALWRCCHGVVPESRTDDEASTPPDGTKGESAAPSPPQPPLMEVSSV